LPSSKKNSQFTAVSKKNVEKLIGFNCTSLKDIVLEVLNPTREAHWKGCTLCQVGLISRAL